jgi:hypothetical protein
MLTMDTDGRAQHTYGTTGTTGTTGMNTGMNTGNTYTQNEYGTGSTNAGPHNSNMANKMDPRVDSDLGKNTSPFDRPCL